MDTKPNQGGRPLEKDVVQDEIIKFRLTPAEKELVRKAAEIQNDMTISEYIRQVILNYSAAEIGINKGVISERAYLDFVTIQAEGRAKTSSTGEVTGPELDFKEFLEKNNYLSDAELDKAYALIFNVET